MNRIILIGNGFDLAHKMKTSFCDFLDDYWRVEINEIIESIKSRKFENENFIIPEIPPTLNCNNYKDLLQDLKNYQTEIIFKNRFLKIITERSNLENWVDIENEYYLLLKKCFKDPKDKYDVTDLNNDFNKIKNALEKYISKIEKEFNLTDKELKWKIGFKIFSRFKMRDFNEISINEKVKAEFNKVKNWVEGVENGDILLNDVEWEQIPLVSKLTRRNHYDVIRGLLLSDADVNHFDLEPKTILFLNFNYTKTEELYTNSNQGEFYGLKEKPNVDTIHIHGSVNPSKNNPIVFGFGDEKDDEYKSLEKLDDRYLEHIKSIKYLETDNYKRLLEYINSDKYQILILGHSCGLSDRTLLSTLFENQNCVSIKPYFHQKSLDQDNFNRITMNITRNFSNKASLRDKVTNKKYCEPLVNV